MYSLEFTITGLPKIISNASRGHWAVNYKHKKTWAKLVRIAIGAKLPRAPLKVASAEFTRYSSVEPDFDNNVSSWKAVIDAIVRAGVLENDRPSNLPNAKFNWQYAKRGQGRIHVKIMEVSA
jgi:Holliday junction resolvase RusA-like endonuclease